MKSGSGKSELNQVVQMCKCANVQMCKCENVQMCKSRLPINCAADLPVSRVDNQQFEALNSFIDQTWNCTSKFAQQKTNNDSIVQFEAK